MVSLFTYFLIKYGQIEVIDDSPKSINDAVERIKSINGEDIWISHGEYIK